MMKSGFKVKGLIAVFLSLILSAPATAGELGLQLYSLRHQMAEDLPAALAHVREWGLEVVDGGGTLHGHTADSFRDHLEKNGLKVVSVDTTYEELRDNPMAAVYKARFFGADYAT